MSLTCVFAYHAFWECTMVKKIQGIFQCEYPSVMPWIPMKKNVNFLYAFGWGLSIASKPFTDTCKHSYSRTQPKGVTSDNSFKALLSGSLWKPKSNAASIEIDLATKPLTHISTGLVCACQPYSLAPATSSANSSPHLPVLFLRA